jgi:putative two-component system response regulator
MARDPVVLLVDDDETTLSVLSAVLRRSGVRVEVERSGEEAMVRARELRPDVIISDYWMPGMTGFDLCRQVRAEPALAGTMFLMLTAYGEAELKLKGLELGVDDYLTKPIEAAELVARVRAALRLTGLYDELRREKQDLEHAHAELAASFEQLVRLLVRLLDVRVPGADARGRRLAAAARRVAVRLEVPEERLAALEVAARLHEIGRIGMPEREAAPPEMEDLTVGGVSWRYVPAASAVLGAIERFQEAAELVAALAENWDGTGLPRRLSQGQIPMRSRILRVLMDFFALLDQAGPSADARQLVAQLEQHANRYYDPVVLSQLAALVAEGIEAWHPCGRKVSLEELQEGMVLAEDLVTSSGVKLLARGARVTAPMLQLIRRRHASDPVIYGACVES